MWPAIGNPSTCWELRGPELLQRTSLGCVYFCQILSETLGCLFVRTASEINSNRLSGGQWFLQRELSHLHSMLPSATWSPTLKACEHTIKTARVTCQHFISGLQKRKPRCLSYSHEHVFLVEEGGREINWSIWYQVTGTWVFPINRFFNSSPNGEKKKAKLKQYGSAKM